MTGIERLRELIGAVDSSNTLWSITSREYDQAHGLTSISSPMLRDVLADIADQIVREQDKVAKMDWDAVREVAADMAGRVFMSATIDGLLRDWSRKLTDAADGHDHADDVSMSAYDLLPQEEREAVAWVREHGGVEFLDLHWGNMHRLVAEVARRLGYSPDCEDCEPDELLDALDRRLMPEGMEWLAEAWPRFEDDVPLKFGDVALIDGEADMVEAVQLWIHGKPVIYGDGGSQQLERGERVKRPAPKVLDADGVPISEGDTVYHVNSGIEYSVRSVTNGGAHLSKGDRHGGYCRAEYLTHEQPDSWERLEEDAAKNPFDYCKDVGHRLDTCENAEAYKARDLVRRAKALAERDA